MATTKPKPDERFINYPGKIYDSYRKYKTPFEISTLRPYLKDIGFQAKQEYKETEYLGKLMFDSLPAKLAPYAKGVDEKEIKLRLDDLAVENPEFVKSLEEHMIEDSWNDEMEYYMITSENSLWNNMTMQEKGLYATGSPKPKKIYYSSIANNIKTMITINPRQAGYVRFIGDPGTGKTNGGLLLTESALDLGYWVYSNIPVKALREGQFWAPVYVINSISDLFIDSVDMPSILRVRTEAQKQKRTIGAVYLRDEKARDMERYAQSKEVTSEASTMQLRGHLYMPYIGLGVMDDVGEVKNAQTAQVETRSAPTGKYRRKTGEEIKRYWWKVRTRKSSSSQYHEETTVEGIPPATVIQAAYGNQWELPNPVIPDMSISDFFSAVPDTNVPDEEMIERGRAWALEAKEAYRQYIEGRKAKIEKEADKKINPKLAYCYDCESLFYTLQKEERPKCGKCMNRNTVTDAPTLLAIINRQHEGKTLVKEEIAEDVKKFGRKQSIDLSR